MAPTEAVVTAENLLKQAKLLFADQYKPAQQFSEPLPLQDGFWRRDPVNFRDGVLYVRRGEELLGIRLYFSGNEEKVTIAYWAKYSLRLVLAKYPDGTFMADRSPSGPEYTIDNVPEDIFEKIGDLLSVKF